MFTAIQARNIANEKYNHDYYKIYKRHSAAIMRGIVRSAKQGYTSYDFSTYDAKRITMGVLKQIANELQAYGYNTRVSVEQTSDGKRKYGYMRIDWVNAQ